jgi:arginase
MDLALATGHGPDLLTGLRGLRPLVRETDVVLLGHRDEDEGYPPDLLDLSRTVMRSIDLAEARRTGMKKAVLDSFDRLRRNGAEGVWIHLDVDVLDVDRMPAVDSPEPGGLTYAELDEILTTALSSGMAAGLEITIFDPDLDPDGRIAAGFVEALAGVFRDD